MRLLTTLFLTISFSASGQSSVPFEQAAFDFYANKILKNNPPKKPFTLWKNLESWDYLFWAPGCLNDFKFKSKDSINVNPSGQTILQFEADERFKVKKVGTGAYPRIYLTVSFSTTPDQHVVTIVEMYKHHGITYHIEMDDKGKVKNWCKGGWIE